RAEGEPGHGRDVEDVEDRHRGAEEGVRRLVPAPNARHERARSTSLRVTAPRTKPPTTPGRMVARARMKSSRASVTGVASRKQVASGCIAGAHAGASWPAATGQ